MEGVRGFAVFLVFLVHYATAVVPWVASDSALASLAHDLRIIGRTGVDLFFVLSGYLIYGSLMARPQPFLQFMRRRVERIYPAFTAVFLGYIALSFVFPAESRLPAGTSAAAAYLLQNFLLLPGMLAIEPLISVAWSLSYEMFFYLAIPLVIALLSLRTRHPAQRVGLCVAITAAIVGWCAIWDGHVRLIMFVSGMLLYEARTQRPAWAPGSGTALGALLLGILSSLLPLPGPSGEALRATILFAAFLIPCHACVVRTDGWLPRAFTWTPLRWLGNMSYSYYLLHGLALQAGFTLVAKLLPPAAQGSLFFWSLLPVMFAITLVPTAILFLVIERPLSLAPQHAADDSTSRLARLAARYRALVQDLPLFSRFDEPPGAGDTPAVGAHVRASVQHTAADAPAPAPAERSRT
jgi:peptidoglycan/LPS O-acetylase OafA/YrhL